MVSTLLWCSIEKYGLLGICGNYFWIYIGRWGRKPRPGRELSRSTQVCCDCTLRVKRRNCPLLVCCCGLHPETGNFESPVLSSAENRRWADARDLRPATSLNRAAMVLLVDRPTAIEIRPETGNLESPVLPSADTRKRGPVLGVRGLSLPQPGNNGCVLLCGASPNIL